MNRWNIPDWLEREVLGRDLRCVYCGVEFGPVKSSWEHIVNDASIVTPENIARCCVSCNASKGAKDLASWLESNYCKSRGISATSIAAVVLRQLHADAVLGP